MGALLDLLDGADPTVLVVNLFPKLLPRPTSLAEVLQTMTNLMFVNKTESDLRLLKRFNAVADLAAALRKAAANGVLPQSALDAMPGWPEVQGYRRTRDPIEVTRASEAKPLEGSDFSAEGIVRRADEGRSRTEKALRARGLWVP